MANKGTKTGIYQPGNISYTYVYDILTYIPDYSAGEISVLESNGYDASYPSQYCNSTVYGGSEQFVGGILNYRVSGGAPVITTPDYGGYAPTSKEFEDNAVELDRPLRDLMSAATSFTSGMEFGQPEGDDVPSEIQIETDVENRRSIVKWYKNGAVVAVDTLGHMASGNTVKIAVSGSGNTVTGYAYLFGGIGDDSTMDVYTSGLKTDANVLAILNTMGYAGANEDLFGFVDEELGDFVLSRIFDIHGGDSVSGWATAPQADGTIATENQELEEHCAAYNGWLGTDLIEYAGGWNYLNTNPDSDGLTIEIPTNDNHKYQLIWDYANKHFKQYVDEVYNGYIVTSTYRQEGSHIYITWYRQSLDVEQSTALCTVYMIRDGGLNVPYYIFTTLFQGQNIDPELTEFDNESAFKDGIEGYDPSGGQEDDDQEDAEDVQDPAYDALGNGFLFAFMVDDGDMTNLADALVPDTLAQKIRTDFGNNLFDFIVSYHIMPCLTNGDSLNKIPIAYRGQPFVYGENDTQLQLAPISQSFYTVGCGSRVCWPQGTRPEGFENWANANIQLYLPFIGYVHLNTADVWKKTITIWYKFDILQGTCVANVNVGSNGTMYSYEGSCKYSIPFTSIIDHSNAQLLSGIFSSAGAAVSIGGVIAGGSPAGLIGAAGNIADAAGGFISAAQHKSTINRGGCLSGAPGWQMPRHPALIITVPDYIRPDMIYNDLNGYPTFKSGLISNWQNNYIECGQIKLEAAANSSGAVPNDNELDLIKSILKGGVYV